MLTQYNYHLMVTVAIFIAHKGKIHKNCQLAYSLKLLMCIIIYNQSKTPSKGS